MELSNNALERLKLLSILCFRLFQNKINGTITFDQTSFINETLHKFGMDDCNLSIPIDMNQQVSSKLCPSTKEEKKRMSEVPHTDN